jgi:hypothetical protein
LGGRTREEVRQITLQRPLSPYPHRTFSEADAQQVHDVAFEAWRFTYRDIHHIEHITNFVNVNYAPEQPKRFAGGAAVGTLFFDVLECRSRVNLSST